MEKYSRKNEVRSEQIVSREVTSGSDKLSNLMEVLNHPDYRGYGFIGGAARALAFKLYNDDAKNIDLPIRDIDLCRFEGSDPKLADNLAKSFSEDDYEHGYGVQEIDDLVEYMNTRDFTMNQVCYLDGRLIASKHAIHDISRGVIRPCEDRLTWDDIEDNDGGWTASKGILNYNLQTRPALKAVLQKIVMSKYLPNIRIETGLYNDSMNFSEDYHSRSQGFQLALALQKAFEYGKGTANKLIQEIIYGGMFIGDLDAIVNDDGSPRSAYDVMRYLNQKVLTFPFEYRGMAQKYYLREAEYCRRKTEQEYYEVLGADGKLDQLPKHQSMRR